MIMPSKEFSIAQIILKLTFERQYLDKARNIAEIRSPSRDDGTIARILWKTSKVLEDDALASAEAAELRKRAEIAARTISSRGESSIAAEMAMDKDEIDEDLDALDLDDEEEARYTELVPAFFR
jgi:hypothetical protein